MTLSDLEAADTVVTMYDLPDEAALAMSALFLGLALEREDNLDSRSYFDHVMNWFVTSASTACRTARPGHTCGRWRRWPTRCAVCRPHIRPIAPQARAVGAWQRS